MLTLARHIAGGYLPTAAELAELLDAPDAVWKRLFALAGRVTRKHKGDLVYVRGIIEISSHCRRECQYCGLNRYHTSLPRYRMPADEIVQTALEGWQAGYKTVVLQSGEDAWFTPQRLCDVIRAIKAAAPGIAVTGSFGELPDEAYAMLREAGCDRYLLKHETASPHLYRRLHPDSRLADRLHALKTLKQLGFETGGGFMVGLPGQTTKTLARDLLLLKSIGCDMAGIGPFIPCPGTPLEGAPAGSPDRTRQVVALCRLLLPEANLPATTSLGVLSKRERNKVFQNGANVIMKKLTPPAYRALYEIYPADYSHIQAIKTEREQLNALLTELGKTYD